MLLVSGRWYRSKQALERLHGLRLVNDPHITPDGYAVLVCDLGGAPAPVSVDGKPAPAVKPPCLVPQADSSVDSMQRDLVHATVANGQVKAGRVEIPVDGLSDLEPLVEYDHLPAARKDYKVYPMGHKLA